MHAGQLRVLPRGCQDAHRDRHQRPQGRCCPSCLRSPESQQVLLPTGVAVWQMVAPDWSQCWGWGWKKLGSGPPLQACVRRALGVAGTGRAQVPGGGYGVLIEVCSAPCLTLMLLSSGSCWAGCRQVSPGEPAGPRPTVEPLGTILDASGGLITMTWVGPWVVL